MNTIRSDSQPAVSLSQIENVTRSRFHDIFVCDLEACHDPRQKGWLVKGAHRLYAEIATVLTEAASQMSSPPPTHSLNANFVLASSKTESWRKRIKKAGCRKSLKGRVRSECGQVTSWNGEKADAITRNEICWALRRRRKNVKSKVTTADTRYKSISRRHTAPKSPPPRTTCTCAKGYGKNSQTWKCAIAFENHPYLLG